MKHAENRLRNISNLLNAADKNLRKANKLLDTMRQEIDSSFDDVPGVLGIFDGTHMADAEGKRHEVNPNYAAKSLLVSGDNLKMVEEDGKQLFKQVSKVDRKQLEGVLNKKEGKWYALTDDGSYRLLDVSIEFRDGEVNDEVTVLVPADNLKSEWGVLEKMAKEEGKVEDGKPEVEEKEEKEEKPKKKPAAKKEEKKPAVKKKAPAKKRAAAKPAAKPAAKKKTTRKPAKKAETPAAEVNSLLDDDDLR